MLTRSPMEAAGEMLLRELYHQQTHYALDPAHVVALVRAGMASTRTVRSSRGLDLQTWRLTARGRQALLAAAMMLLVAVPAMAEGRPSAPASTRTLLAAIRAVESGGNDRAVGDGRRSIGPYQIQLRYWIDSGRTAESWRKAFEEPAARAAVIDYWRRYAPQALATGDWQRLARVHNGGPGGHRLSATREYWRRVKAHLR